MAYTGKNKPDGRKLSPQRIYELERTAAAIELRKRGWKFDDIAQALGWKNRNGAYQAILGALTRNIREPAQQLIELEVERLDAMLASLWPAAMAGDAKVVLAILKIQERRAKYLGLDKPVERNLNVHVSEEPPAPPVDLKDFQARMFATLSNSGAFEVQAQLELNQGPTESTILEADYEERIDALIRQDEEAVLVTKD